MPITETKTTQKGVSVKLLQLYVSLLTDEYLLQSIITILKLLPMSNQVVYKEIYQVLSDARHGHEARSE